MSWILVVHSFASSIVQSLQLQCISTPSALTHFDLHLGPDIPDPATFPRVPVLFFPPHFASTSYPSSAFGALYPFPLFD
ncbi:hypothetical protein BDQ94DRAFT_139929, partial [Aspergillus welwitschiae]